MIDVLSKHNAINGEERMNMNGDPTNNLIAYITPCKFSVVWDDQIIKNLNLVVDIELFRFPKSLRGVDLNSIDWRQYINTKTGVWFEPYHYKGKYGTVKPRFSVDIYSNDLATHSRYASKIAIEVSPDNDYKRLMDCHIFNRIYSTTTIHNLLIAYLTTSYESTAFCNKGYGGGSYRPLCLNSLKEAFEYYHANFLTSEFKLSNSPLNQLFCLIPIQIKGTDVPEGSGKALSLLTKANAIYALFEGEGR